MCHLKWNGDSGAMGGDIVYNTPYRHDQQDSSPPTTAMFFAIGYLE